MLLWFAGLAFVITWQVFQSPAIDFRMVMLGSLLPLLDVLVGGPTALHTMVGSAAALVLVMVGARGRRLVQRRWVGIAIGMLLHLALDGAWSNGDLFWWPFLAGADLTGVALPELERSATVLVVMEAVGAAALLWCWRAFGFSDPDRRRRFVSTGQLDRALVR